MRFIGCALAWRPGEAREKESCLVVMDERGSIIANTFAGTPEELRGAVEAYGEDRRGVIVGVDAPLAVPNERGTRKIERILSKVALPAYSASRRMFGDAPLSEELLAELEKIGVEYTDYPFPKSRGQSTVVEVDSSATLKVLSLERSGDSNGDPAGQLRSMDDPKFRKGNKEGRASAIRGAVEVLWDTPGLRLRTGNLSPDLAAPENIDLSKLDVSASMSHADLDRILALVEGTLAAYTVHRHWRGRDGSMVLGSGDQGSVLLPAKDALRGRIAEEARAAKVPYVSEEDKPLGLKVRIVPCLDVNAGRVVKGTRFKNLRDAGDPVELAALYDREGADEIVFYDITASHERRETAGALARAAAEEVFVPYTIGGGVRTADDMRAMLRAGADKVSVNSAAVRDPGLIEAGAERFGAQCVVLSVDVKRKEGRTGWEVYLNGGRVNTGMDAVDWLVAGERRGAGEFVLNSMDADGTESGYDLDLISTVAEKTSVPIVASGGAGGPEHMISAVRAGAGAVLAASIFHFGEYTIREVKEALERAGIPVRLSEAEVQNG